MIIEVTHAIPQNTSPQPCYYDVTAFAEAFPELGRVFVRRDGREAESGTQVHWVGYYNDGEPFSLKARVFEEITAEALGNQHGFRCPQCRSGEALQVNATQSLVARLVPDGTDTDDTSGEMEWEGTSGAICVDCGWVGTVAQLIAVDVVDAPPQLQARLENPPPLNPCPGCAYAGLAHHEQCRAVSGTLPKRNHRHAEKN